jgi:ABC-2 type transport system ATP-binding protein
MAEEYAIQTQGLKKNYGKVRALIGVDLVVQVGEIFGFLGPNGAGKTTAIRCMLDLIHPDAGMLRVLNINPQTDPVAVRARTGYLPGELRVDDNQTSEEALHYFNALRGRKADREYVRQLASRLDLNLKIKIKNLSKGNKQKVGIIQALMHKPELLILDEPTSGLDPLMQQEILKLLREARTAGATIFFCTHIISEAEAIADRVGIIRSGEVVEVVQPGMLIQRSLRRVRIRFRNPVTVETLAGVMGVRGVDQFDPFTLELQFSGEMEALMKRIADLPVVDLDSQRPSLEEVFLSYYENEPKEK